MFCLNCSAQRPDDTSPCPNCGMPAAPMEPLPPPRPHIPNYLAPSILVTLCCCLPLGIPAIIYSAQVNPRAQAGDINGAMDSSNKAKMWVVIAFAAGTIGGVLYGLAVVAGALG